MYNMANILASASCRHLTEYSLCVNEVYGQARCIIPYLHSHLGAGSTIVLVLEKDMDLEKDACHFGQEV